MKVEKWICGCTVMALLFMGIVTSKAYAESQAETINPSIQTPRSQRSLGPQPEPPDRQRQQAPTKKGIKRPQGETHLGPQPEPPDRPRSDARP